MMPISDDNRGRRSQPLVTWILIGINIIIFVYQWSLSARSEWKFVLEWGTIPREISEGTDLFTLVTCTFLHGSWLHLGSNMLFLWVFGDNVEDVMGKARYLLFYLVTGVAASAAQVFLNADSTTPLVGASGAISGVLAAYLVLFPHGKIVTLIFLGVFATTTFLPAWVMIGYWIVIQILQGVLSLGVQDVQQGGVAYFAHIGGFVAGLALAFLLADRDRVSSQRAARSGYNR